MAGRKLAILGAGLLIAVGLAFLVEGSFHTEQTASATLSGASTKKRWIAVAPGRVEPLSREIKVSAPVMGRITEVLVKPNDKVFTGELLVRLDDTEALARLAAAQSQADLSKLDRNEAAARKGSAERRKAEDGVADAERVVADARDALDRVAAARSAGRTSQASFDSARVALSLAQDRLGEQQDTLRRIKAAAGTVLPSRSEGELNVSRADLRVAEAGLEKTRVRAPLAGTVLQVPAKAGELAVPAAEMVVMGDLSALRVRAELDERDLVKIHVGQRVVVRTDAFGDREFDGKVAVIDQVVGPSRISARGQRKFTDVDVMDVLIDLTDPGPLVTGMQASVYFSLDTSEQPNSR